MVIMPSYLRSNTCVDRAKSDTSSTVITKTKSKTSKTRWAIVCLVKDASKALADVDKRNKKLAAMITPYANQHDITMVFFSEATFPESTLVKWRKTFHGLASVRYMNTAKNAYGGNKYGYKYMCKFFSLDMYEYLANDYDYFMRVDTDCNVSPTKYDVFKWIETNNVEYSFAARKIEGHKLTRDTLPKYVQKYSSECGIQATLPMDEPMSTCFNFYNNWHIGKVSFFTRPDVQHFLHSVNATGGILEHRWGDSTVQAYAVRLFMDPRHLQQAPNFTYLHGSHNARITTEGDGSATKLPQRLPMWKGAVPTVSP